jgi:uncharacterized protein (DUF3820 family)
MANEQGNVVPFGKYKGRSIEEVLLDDPGYLQWLAGQDWFRAKFAVLYQVIINRGGEPQDTPEHNALQVKFLDEAFCWRFLEHLAPGFDFGGAVDCEFECGGVDVVMSVASFRDEIPASVRRYFHDWEDEFSVPGRQTGILHIELKPTVGDDYPAVLRQMKANESGVLLLGDYVGTSAAREQFIKTFATADKRVVFLSDVEAR